MRTPTRKDRDPNLPPVEDAETPQPPTPRPMVAVVGRPNVGKSTLFNRIIGRRKALVHDRPGATRDRNIEPTDWEGVEFLLVDTGGYDLELDDPLLAGVVEQVRLAIDEADAIIYLAAVDEPDHPADAEIVRLLRNTRKPVFIAVNKCDNARRELEANEFYRLGVDAVHPVSALHGLGIGDLLSDVVAALRKVSQPTGLAGGAGLRLALVGRQNVGKSTLINQLAGQARVLATSLPGTTRDAIDTHVTAPDGTPFTIIDTAGIRRRGKVQRGIEHLSVLAARMNLERTDVAALLVDAIEGLTEQDAHIAGYCVDAGRPTMILVNKWDAVDKDTHTADAFTHHIEHEWPFIGFAPVVYLSALSGQRATRVFEIAERIWANATQRIPTAELNEHLARWIARKEPAIARNRRPKIRYMTQYTTAPPSFAVFVNDPTLIHFSYRRYLVNRLRETWDFEGTPIRLTLRATRGKGE